MIFKNAKSTPSALGDSADDAGYGPYGAWYSRNRILRPSRQNICRNRIGVWPDYDAGESRHLLLGGYAIHKCCPNSVSGMQ